MDFNDGELCGEIKNLDGRIDEDFLRAVKELMKKHLINYVQLYWSKF